jgi:hypothetical protein
MKETLKSLFVFVFIVYFVLSMLSGFVLPTISIYFAATVLILALTMMIVSPLLNFLTIKCKFPTFLLMSTLLLGGMMFLLKTFMTDFYIEEYVFNGMSLGTVQIQSFPVSPLISIALFAFLTGLLGGIFRELDNR